MSSTTLSARCLRRLTVVSLFFFNDTATTEISTLSLHDALPISTADKTMSTDAPPQPPTDYTVPAIFKPNVPPDVVDLAWTAKQSFEKGKYHTAEKIYQEILTKAPNTLYSFSNLGVVYFRTGKLKSAELMLKKAV